MLGFEHMTTAGILPNHPIRPPLLSADKGDLCINGRNKYNITECLPGQIKQTWLPINYVVMTDSAKFAISSGFTSV